MKPFLADRLKTSSDEIAEFCQKWNIEELALFGSVLSDRFHAESDIDILLSFQPNSRQGLLTLAKIKHELESILSRDVDIVLKEAILKSDNWIHRASLLDIVNAAHRVLTFAQGVEKSVLST